MARINDINAATPAGTDNLNTCDDQLRALKTDITGSFPGLTGSAADALVATATGPQIEYAATTFTAALKTTYDGYASDITDNENAILANDGEILLLQQENQTYGGRNVGTSSSEEPATWSTSFPGSERVTVTHGLGLTTADYQVVVSPNGPNVDDQSVYLESKSTNSFTYRFTGSVGDASWIMTRDRQP